jgi:hypothetical protein
MDKLMRCLNSRIQIVGHLLRLSLMACLAQGLVISGLIEPRGQLGLAKGCPSDLC